MSHDASEPPPFPPKSASENPPPLPTAPKSSAPSALGKWVWGGVVVLCLIAGISAAVLLAMRSNGSTANDEIPSESKQNDDYRLWKKEFTQLANAANTQKEFAFPAADGKQKISWWESFRNLPHEESVRAALKRRLPDGFRLVSFEPVKTTAIPEGMSVEYRVRLKSASSQFLVPVAEMKPNPNWPKRAQQLQTTLLITSDRIPPGKIVQTKSKVPLLAEGAVVTVPWTIREATKENNVWKIVDAEPLYYQRSTEFETRLFSETPATAMQLVRSQQEIETILDQQQKQLAWYADRITKIQTAVAQFKQDRLANVPSAKFGGSGSGEPTRTAARVGGGAAGGAAIGAAAGGGEGAGWGALGGLVAGGIYDLVSKSNDKKEKQAAHDRALSAARNEISQFEKQLYDQLESELRQASAQAAQAQPAKP